MAEFTITCRIEAPELVAAINNLADALKDRLVKPCVAIPDAPATEVASNSAPVEKLVEYPLALPTNAPVTDIASGVTGATANAAASATDTVTAPVKPETSEPTQRVYTFDDITSAGSQLLELGKMSQLMALLKSYGVQAVTQLKPEQYADVAAGLRGLGAKI